MPIGLHYPSTTSQVTFQNLLEHNDFACKLGIKIIIAMLIFSTSAIKRKPKQKISSNKNKNKILFSLKYLNFLGRILKFSQALFHSCLFFSQKKKVSHTFLQI
jgi:hypothetical protein